MWIDTSVIDEYIRITPYHEKIVLSHLILCYLPRLLITERFDLPRRLRKLCLSDTVLALERIQNGILIVLGAVPRHCDAQVPEIAGNVERYLSAQETTLVQQENTPYFTQKALSLAMHRRNVNESRNAQPLTCTPEQSCRKSRCQHSAPTAPARGLGSPRAASPSLCGLCK